ncbi:MAG TPA: plasmid pRiA4b ORF-3 family protein [Verrucomicrobiota bacterium]|nr:plasmid pRiA4b ORF-3 family protein [Verrucomicrobiota bacterium]HRZ56555.1 plasmid pRiA4b ORF-3 family protein [Candidatus Paceibacterota bacterium]
MLSLYHSDGRAWRKWNAMADQCQRVLTEQQVAPAQPGTILKDVASLIEFVGPEGIAVKSRNASLPVERLPELNRQASYPIQLALKRALLRDYPNLAGVFILLRVMELLQVKGNRLMVCPAAWNAWRGLNSTEQYFALLEALLFEAQSSVIGGHRTREEAEPFETIAAFLGHLSDRWRSFDHYESAYTFGPQGLLPPWTLFVQQQLGLIEIRPRPVLAKERRDWGGRGWLVGGARLTPWGTAVTWALLEFWKEEVERVDEAEDEPEEEPDESSRANGAEAPFGVLQRVFQPYFPEWRTVYTRPNREVRSGTHLFKVTLAGWRGGGGSIWRRLAVPPDTSLDGLAGAILKAFNLDDDHLHDFRYRDQRGKNRVYNHPYTDEGPYTPEIAVAETDLAVKGEMRFTFDYGDYWQFVVRLEAVEAGPCRLKQPAVLESAGTAPEQYPEPGE